MRRGLVFKPTQSNQVDEFFPLWFSAAGKNKFCDALSSSTVCAGSARGFFGGKLGGTAAGKSAPAKLRQTSRAAGQCPYFAGATRRGRPFTVAIVFCAG